ncbi:hypothetical protein O181_086775 [Austropuccinia psidii MF-1]|uniref:Uncharacterized protein n=1 Tax=Austropuccinia psidii MF-1 TaxID=1389203 RepID=A0A9Q3INE8_9BASI|nr:hypothetical protein [Austropuccinia psidii MF-1]
MLNGRKLTHGFEIVSISRILEEVSKQQKSTYNTNGLLTDDVDDNDNIAVPYRSSTWENLWFSKVHGWASGVWEYHNKGLSYQSIPTLFTVVLTIGSHR